MSDLKHTPGPWRLVYDETDAANARLIASAPDLAAECERLRAVNAELMAALKACIEYGAVTWSDDPENEPNCYREARAALAKAK